ncbi:MAG: Rrf2 family transcriptional regulator [Syntrophobacter sp.]
MRLTCRSEYALLALAYLSRCRNEEYISVQMIAAAQAIPPKFLEQILLSLRLGKYVHSLKGKNGGFRLAKSPDKITLAEIIRLFDGPLAPTESVSMYFYEPTPIEKEEGLLALFKEVRDYVADKMEKTTIADVAGINAKESMPDIKGSNCG